jgi:hypothetical protein
MKIEASKLWLLFLSTDPANATHWPSRDGKSYERIRMLARGRLHLFATFVKKASTLGIPTAALGFSLPGATIRSHSPEVQSGQSVKAESPSSVLLTHRRATRCARGRARASLNAGVLSRATGGLWLGSGLSGGTPRRRLGYQLAAIDISEANSTVSFSWLSLRCQIEIRIKSDLDPA